MSYIGTMAGTGEAKAIAFKAIFSINETLMS